MFIPDLVGLESLLHSVDGPVMLHTRVIADRIKDRAAANLEPHNKSSRLVNSLRVELSRESTGPVATIIAGNDSDLDYALPLHEGSEPHTITGNPFLSFFWSPPGPPYSESPGPGFYRFRSVNHPGYSGDPYLTNAIQEE